MSRGVPQWMRDIEACYGLEKFRRRAAEFAGRGVSVAHVLRRGWRFYCIGRADGPTYVICWVGLGALCEMLDDVEGTLRSIEEMGGRVLPAAGGRP